MTRSNSAKEVFDRWALDYHAPGMEEDHHASVEEAFTLVQPSKGLYLEVGVGNGYGLQHMAQNQYRDGSCIGIDVSPNMVALTKERVSGLRNAEVMEADFLTFEPDVAPDLIFSMEVFYYLPEIQQGIDHAMNLLAPGGTLMVLVNHYHERLDSHDWASQLDTHMQLWTAAEYAAGFETAGFLDVRQGCFATPSDPEHRLVNPGTLGTWGRKPE